MKELKSYCNFSEPEFAKQHMSVDFASYDLLRSITISESIEKIIPPVMFDVLGTVLDEIPKRNPATVYQTPSQEEAGETHVLGAHSAVDTLRGMTRR